MNQQRPEMDLPLFLPPRRKSAPPSQQLLSVVYPEMLRNPVRHAVSWAWMCQHGPLASIGPPCLFSPYRSCVSTARAFSVPGRREGGSERASEGRGGRAEEGGRERRGEGGEESKCRSYAVPPAVPGFPRVCLVISHFSVAARSRVSGRPQGVFTGVQQSTVTTGGG